MIYYDTYWHSTTISFAQSPMASNAPIMPTSDPTTTEDVSHPEGEEARDEEEALRAYPPASSGMQTNPNPNPNKPCEHPLPSPNSKSRPPGSGDAGDSSSSPSDDDGDDEDEFPTSHELTIPAHTKPFSRTTVGASGTRFAATSHDC